MNDIDWTNSEAQVSTYFKVKECLFLPSWGRMANESDGLNNEIKANLEALCAVLDQIRASLACPMRVHCMYRPGPYSALVGGSATDVHTRGLAVDFDCDSDMTCDQVKELLMPQLEAWGVRMENNGDGAGWVHIDTAPVGHARFFLP